MAAIQVSWTRVKTLDHQELHGSHHAALGEHRERDGHQRSAKNKQVIHNRTMQKRSGYQLALAFEYVHTFSMRIHGKYPQHFHWEIWSTNQNFEDVSSILGHVPWESMGCTPNISNGDFLKMSLVENFHWSLGVPHPADHESPNPSSSRSSLVGLPSEPRSWTGVKRRHAGPTG